MRHLVSTLVTLALIAGAMIALLWAFDSGQHSRCAHYRHQGGPQWAIERYC